MSTKSNLRKAPEETHRENDSSGLKSRYSETLIYSDYFWAFQAVPIPWSRTGSARKPTTP